MKIKYFQGCISILAVIAALLLISHPAWGTGSTTDWYEIYGTANPFVELNDTESGKMNWYLITDWDAASAFSVYAYDGGTYNASPLIIESGCGDNLLYLDSLNRIGINTSVPAYTVDAVGTEIRLRSDTSATAKTIALRTDGTATDIQADNVPLYIRTDMGATDYGIYLLPGAANVGIGTTGPTQKLHVNGSIMSNGQYLAQYAYPGFWLDETGTGNKGLYYVLDQKSLQIQRRAQNFGAFEATVMHVFIEAPANSFYLASNGYVGFGLAPSYPIHHSNGARLSAGGVWTDASSREYKENINTLTVDEAVNALKGLNPVKFNYKADTKEKHVGFVAEDVPEIVATRDRKGLSPMDIVAVLTKVSQEQQKTIAVLTEKVAELEKEVRWNKSHAAVSNLK